MKRVNLLPGEIESNRTNLRERLIFTVISLGLLGWLLVSFYGQQILMARYRSLIAQENAHIQNLQGEFHRAKDFVSKIQEEREKIDAKKKDLVKKLSTLEQLKKEKMVHSNVLLELSEIIPLEIRLHKVSLNEEYLLLSGEALDNMVVGHFMAQLDSSNLFERTSFNYIEKKAAEGKLPFIEFELITHLSR